MSVYAVLKGCEFYREFRLVGGNWTVRQEEAKTWKTRAGAERQAKESQALYAAKVRVVTIAAPEEPVEMTVEESCKGTASDYIRRLNESRAKTLAAMTPKEKRASDNIIAALAKSRLRPWCHACGWREGGIDSWDGLACKCGKTSPPLATDIKTP